MSHEISLSNLTPMNNGSTNPRQSPMNNGSTDPRQSPMNNGSTDQRQSPSPPQGYPSANSQTLSVTTNSNNAPQNRDVMRNKWFEDMRGWIMVVAVLVASVTYTTGLNPPGGFWQDDLYGHNAGSPILRDKMETRYTTFFYANATAFMASLIIIILLMNETFYTNPAKVVMLNICMILDLVSMMIAYAAGCARSLKTSIYIIVLGVGVLLFVIFSSSLLPSFCYFVKDRMPVVEKIVGRDLFPEKESEKRNMIKNSSI